MSTLINDDKTGLEVLDLETDPGFATRSTHARNVAAQTEGLRRLAVAFIEKPDVLLQELVNAAVEICGAESAGISLQDPTAEADKRYQWVATAGAYAPFLHAILPATPSACGVTLERNRPQLFRVSQKFFDIMGVDAPTVTDGILIPWQEEETRGTFWIMSHSRSEAFDAQDANMLQLLSSFAAMAIRQQRQHKLLMQQARIAAAAEMAHDLAHQINNPLQSLTNLAYLASQGIPGQDPQELALSMATHLARLSTLVRELLVLPIAPVKPK